MPTSRKWGIGLLLCIALVSSATFVYRLQENFYETPLDFLIFLKAAKNYQLTGELYQRAENYQDKYHPSAAIFKFPPPFELALLPLTQVPRDIDLLLILKSLLTGMYFLSIVLVFLHLKKTLGLAPEKQVTLASLMAITSFWFMPYFESIRWLLTEIPLLLLFVVSFLLLQGEKKSSFVSGALLAYASCIKIYPVFMAVILLLKKSKAALIGFFIGATAVMALSLAVFGIQEHLFYFGNILPVLLGEEVTSKWVNLNLEKFLFITGLISEINGHAFQVIRFLTLLALALVVIRNREALHQQPFLAFSLLISTMFFCFPNYWPQYQIYLIIPLSYLYGCYIRQNHTRLLGMTLLLAAILCVPDTLSDHIAAVEIPWRGVDPVQLQKTAMEQGSGITFFKELPLSWAGYYLYECRSLVPLLLWFLLLREVRVRILPGSW